MCRALHVSTFRPHPPWLASAPFSSAYHHSVCGGAARHPSTEAEGQAHPYMADYLRAGSGGGNAPADEDELNILRSQWLLQPISPCHSSHRHPIQRLPLVGTDTMPAVRRWMPRSGGSSLSSKTGDCGRRRSSSSQRSEPHTHQSALVASQRLSRCIMTAARCADWTATESSWASTTCSQKRASMMAPTICRASSATRDPLQRSLVGQSSHSTLRRWMCSRRSARSSVFLSRRPSMAARW